MAYVCPTSDIKELTFSDVQRLIREGNQTRGYIMTHSGDGGENLSGIIVIQFDSQEVFHCAPLTASLGLCKVNDEFPVVLELCGRTLYLEIHSGLGSRLATKRFSYTF
ncbi:MAG: hypothetical protein ABII19_00055 [Patescibacteria group bacterium]